MVSDSSSGACSAALHVLRCIGFVGADRLANTSGLAPGLIEECLNRLSNEGLAILAPGPFGGWGVTDAGRSADDKWLVRQLESVDGREQIRGYYDQFLGLNPTLLQVCSDWQIRRIGISPTLNDHSDPEYDAKVLSQLLRIDESAQGLYEGLANILERFSVYSERLSSALGRAMAGEHSYVADGLDSYHTIWFQLHEDLLTTLGISRDEERRASGDAV